MSDAGWTATPGTPDPAARPRPGVGADEALAGFPIVAPALARPLDRVRLTPIVAGALRAALDSLTADVPGRAVMRVGADDAVLEVRIDRVDPQGLVPAGGVLETVEASLVPAAHASRQWIVRAPVLAPVESFLMIERGDLALALPWHAVSRVRMVRAKDLAAIAEQEGAGVVAGFGTGPAHEDEVPAVLVALGLRRAWIAVDRLVWRLPASPDPAPPPPPRPGLGPALVTAEGARYWLLELPDLLHGIEYPALPSFGNRLPEGSVPMPALDPEPAPEAAPPAAKPADAEPTAVEPPIVPVEAPRAVPAEAPAATPAPATQSAPAPPHHAVESMPVVIPAFEQAARPVLRLVTLTSEDVTPFGDDGLADLGLAAPEPARAEPAPEFHAPADPTPDAASAARPRVLMAEDSITARIFLGRLLEQLGFEVHAVTSLRELREALENGPWAIVMADVELPDARGARVLAGLHARSGRGPAPVVALVRDADDAAVARSAGVPHTLRKPFERDELERLLLALDWSLRRA